MKRHLLATALLPLLALTACQTGDTSSAASTAPAAVQAAESDGASTSSSSDAAEETPSPSTTSLAQSEEPTQEPSSDSSPTSTASATSGEPGKGPGSDAPHAVAAGSGPLLLVAGIVDGDTIKVWIDGKREKVRLIGVDTPETVKPGYGVACFGKQASSKMQSLVQSKQVRLQADPSQGNLDKYGRLLRYVFLPDGTDVAQALIAGGYGREYTYDTAYLYRSSFLAAQSNAQAKKLGLWGQCTYASAFSPPLEGAAPGQAGPAPAASAPAALAGESTGKCLIKGNINAKGEKIYHVPGGRSYAKTKINKPGEQWFCTEAQAQAAGFRAARD